MFTVTLPVTESQPDLVCDHEEADTRLLLHGKHSDGEGGGPTVIWSPDTDVDVLCLAHSSSYRRGLLFSTGTGNKRRLLNTSSMASDLGQCITECLIGLHTFTGCDSTSSFFGRGKASVFKHAAGNKDFGLQLAMLGNTWDVNKDLQTSLAKFICSLYG